MLISRFQSELARFQSELALGDILPMTSPWTSVASLAGVGSALALRVKATKNRVAREEKDFIVLGAGECMIMLSVTNVEDGRH